jgi:hypothetical protein
MIFLIIDDFGLRFYLESEEGLNQNVLLNIYSDTNMNFHEALSLPGITMYARFVDATTGNFVSDEVNMGSTNIYVEDLIKTRKLLSLNYGRDGFR